MKPESNSTEISQPNDSTSKKARYDTDKRNLVTLRDEMMRHLGGYHPSETKIGIAGSSRQPTSSRDMSGTEFNQEDLEPAPDPGLIRTLYRRATGRNPKDSAFRVSDVTREIIKQVQGVLEQMRDPSRSPSITDLNKSEVIEHIYSLIVRALKQQDLALKRKDGGSETDDSDINKKKREDARKELRMIADDIEAWQKYIKHGGQPPRTQPDAATTPEVYRAYQAMRLANPQRSDGEPHNSGVREIEDRFINAVEYIESHQGCLSNAVEYIENPQGHLSLETGQSFMDAIGESVGRAIEHQQLASSGTNEGNAALQLFAELTEAVETKKTYLQGRVMDWNENINSIRGEIEACKSSVDEKLKRHPEVADNLVERFNDSYRLAKQQAEEARRFYDAPIGAMEGISREWEKWVKILEKAEHRMFPSPSK